ncbi:Ig-like domain-containing protein [Robertmurraya sp. P23]|uniref:Ig-like domain-containing protein n=1 Tax=Robertmurraya sp. P23 TaxID=3436931 RepID=UPI003D9615C9
MKGIKLIKYVIFALLTLVVFNSTSLEVNGTLVTQGRIDSPINGASIKGQINVSGWILDSSGVSKVEVLLDGKIIGNAQYGVARPDVLRVFPEYENPNSGFIYSLDTTRYTNGSHTLTVRETGNNGATKELQKLTVNIQNPLTRGNLESPSNGSTIKGAINVKGWVLDSSGVSKVEVFLDGKAVGTAQYGVARPDVHKAYPEYQNPYSGFTYSLDTTRFINGQHTLTVKETGKNGTTKELQKLTVNIQNPSTKGNLESPSNGSTIKGAINVKGWVLDSSGVSKVEVFLDGKVVGTAQYGIARPDVHKAYPEYQNPYSGFTYSLDTTRFINGQHTLTVKETGKNGTTKELQKLIVNIQNAATKGNLESPINGSTVKGNINIKGWALDISGVSKIEVLVDGKITGTAEYGLPRLDVYNAYPEYKNTNSGFQYTLDTKQFTNGVHTISVRETGNNGSITNFRQMSVDIQNPPPKGYIDTPTTGSTIKGLTTIKGWYLDSSGISKIEILVDGKLVGNAQYGISRPDVYSAFPEYQISNSGYEYILDTKQFIDGEHTVTVRATGQNGSISSTSKNIFIGNGNPYVITNLKKPANITASEIVDFFNRRSPNSPLKDYAQSFIDAQNKYGVNAQYLVAHAIWETGWGGSDLRNYKHNLFGYGAYDVCPFTCGYYFPNGPESILKVAYQIRSNYLDSTGSYYYAEHGPTLTGMNVKYATDQNWKNGIANLMQSIKPYDFSYYSNAKELPITASAPKEYGREIPSGQPYPVDTIINFPSGIIAKVTTSSLTFRSLPYVSEATNNGSVSQNTIVPILGFNTDVRFDTNSTGNYKFLWYRANVNGQNGWLYGNYLEILNLLKVNSGGGTLNIRSSASTTSSILTSVNDGSYLKIVLNNNTPVTQNGWYQVYLPNSSSTGWVFWEYTSKIVR